SQGPLHCRDQCRAFPLSFPDSPCAKEKRDCLHIVTFLHKSSFQLFRASSVPDRHYPGMAKDGSLELQKGHGKGSEAMLDSGAWLRVPEGQKELIMLSEVATHCHCHHGRLPAAGRSEGPWGPEEEALGALGL
ncbi:hypothetical protein Nmel_012508, partial [Mimus melanotis]